MRNYTTLDLVRFNRFANENKDLKPIELIKLYNEKYLFYFNTVSEFSITIELIKLYNEKYPEKTAKKKLINISKALGINNLHKALTGNDIPEDERWEHEA